jgi:two-component system response regulator PilR (NtrC family)
MERMVRHDWPGNVRELENVMERAVALETGESIQPERLPPALLNAAHVPLVRPGDGFRLDDHLLAEERRLLEEALAKAGGSRAGAARQLGVTPRSLRYLIRKHGVTPERLAKS